MRFVAAGRPSVYDTYPKRLRLGPMKAPSSAPRGFGLIEG